MRSYAAPVFLGLRVQKSRLSHEKYPADFLGLPVCQRDVHQEGMIYGYALSSPERQSRRLRHGRRRGGKVYRAIVSGATTDRAPLRQGLARLTAGDVLLGTRLDRLARSTRDLRNTLAVMTGRGVGGTPG